jgi:rod shape-determining protein MreC
LRSPVGSAILLAQIQCVLFSPSPHCNSSALNTVTPSTHRRYFPRGPGIGLKAFTLLLCASALMFSDHRGDSLKPVRAGLSFVLYPLVWLATFPHGVIDAAGDLQLRESLEEENRELRDRQLILEAQLRKYAALEAENRRIRELLASADRVEEKVLIAEIIALNQDPYRHQIVLNKGERDGVYRGQALIDAYGILGQVIEVAYGTSSALLITDPDHGIPVQINRTGLQTIAIGRGDGRGLTLPFLPSNADVQEGDLLVSSALGGRFPSGYPVGQIYEVTHTAGEHFMQAFAYPSARLHQGTQALLVWNVNGAQGVPPAAEPLTPRNTP